MHERSGDEDNVARIELATNSSSSRCARLLRNESILIDAIAESAKSRQVIVLVTGVACTWSTDK